jgi:hypothetical protein
VNRGRVLIAAVLASGLIAAGCGDDEEDTTTTATTTEETGTTGTTGATGAAEVTDRASLIEAADAICAAGDEEIDAAAQETFGDAQEEPPAAALEAFVTETVIPNIQDQLDQLRELEPPAEDAGEFTAVIDEAQTALDELESDPSAFVAGDDPFADANRAAQEFGLEDCGS